MQKRPNGLKHGDNPHGIELCTPVIVTINMMLCSGYQNVLRVFKNWPRELGAKFVNIRAFGAFLVSSEIKDGEIQFVGIHSEAGRDCIIDNPWAEKKIQVTRNGKVSETANGKRLVLETDKDELIILRPV